ncbi:sushi domain-containing protein 6 isoform X2 [Lampris incognitus]|uniref:sushi domain-containing protein 6 isoform X2 n=1 Tax=Lampris incognitus TaxID=2546036 RepID=UPI0024B50B51|nr:sushi domain-containing protein 6 isoform X2 [Lampris incognitus]
MSALVLFQCFCVRTPPGYGLLLFLFILASSPCLSTGRQTNCSHPVVPEHGWFRCDPSPCRGFPLKTSIHFFCEPGFHIPSKVRSSKCWSSGWSIPVPACVPLKDKRNASHEDKGPHSLQSVATTAVGVSIFLLTTTACLVIKSRLFPCHSNSHRSSDQLDLMVDGVAVSLPTYEEAVYGSWGQRLSSCSGPGPTQLLLARESPEHHPSPLSNQSDTVYRPRLPSQSPDNPPPPYEEVQSHPREVVFSDGKDT